MDNIKKYHFIPRPVLSCIQLYQAWLVGSGADWYLAPIDTPFPRDLDIMVYPDKFHSACKLFSDYRMEFNSFGGLKISVPNSAGTIVLVDLWPMTLEEYTYKCNGRQIAVRLDPLTIIRWGKE